MRILKEIKRVLTKDGIVRIVLPDLKIMAEKYIDEEKFNDIYTVMIKEKYVGLLGKIKLLFIRPHQWMYTKKYFCKDIKRDGI